MEKLFADIAVVGLGVMGGNLARNILRNGFSVSVYDINHAAVNSFREEFAGAKVFGSSNFSETIRSLATPRKILLAVHAGPTIDKILEQLFPILEANDIVIDCGNSHFKDTERRQADCTTRGISFLGVGMSGGKEGALNGPSLMPGGSAAAWGEVKNILECMAAKAGSQPCVRLIGPGGSGHFVKTIHNGIEYGLMQVIAEAYELMRSYGLPAEEIAEIFSQWSDGRLGSFLIEATTLCLKNRDAETGKSLVDLIADNAEQKGTGKWTIIEALNLGIPCHSLTAGLEARNLSADTKSRKEMSVFRNDRQNVLKEKISKAELLTTLEEALYFNFLICYSQGFSIISGASREYSWNLQLQDIAFIWQAGCIIRSKLLKEIEISLQSGEEGLLLAEPSFKAIVSSGSQANRRLVILALMAEIPVPVLSSSLTYVDSLKSLQLPQNLIQAQRDFFGAHRFARTDKEGYFSVDWLAESKKLK